MQRSPLAEGGALRNLAQALRGNWYIVLGIMLAVLVGCVAWVAKRSPTYEATAKVLVSPVPDDTSFLRLPLVRESASDPTRTLQTAAALVDTASAADLAARKLGDGWTGPAVSAATDVVPQGESDVLAVTARADNPVLAARIANAFVQGAFESRKQVLGPLVRAMLAQTQASLQGLTATSPLAPDLAARANSLRSIQDGTDPTLSVSQPAEPPTSPKGLPTWVLVVLALLAGAALGVGTAVVTELVRGQRVIDEDQLDAITGLPVLARVPRAASELRRTPAADAPVAVTEAFRSLVFQLELGGRQPRSIMVASASRGDGKTTSVAQLGQTLAASGQDVLLIDFDLRNPKLAQELVVEPERDLWQVVSDGGDWKNAVTEVEGREGLRLLVAGSRGDDPGFLAEWVVYVLRDAVAEFDCVIVDTPPLAEVSDALKLSGVVDSILLVTRLSRTPTRSLEIATELLQRTGRPVAGVVLFGSNGHRAAAYMRSARY